MGAFVISYTGVIRGATPDTPAVPASTAFNQQEAVTMRRIITAREQAEMLAPWRTADAAAQTRAKAIMDRRWKEETTSPAELTKQHVKNIKGDPDSQAEWASRPTKGDPTLETGPEHLPQKTLPGMEKIKGTSTRLWRGNPINTSDPAFRRVWQMTYGQGQPVDDPGMFPDADLRYEDRGGNFDHPGLADAIIDGFNAKGGVGEHHSTDYDIGDDYGWGRGEGSDLRGKGPHLPLLLDSDWNGRGENYSRAGSGNFDHEHEIMLREKAPLKVQQIKVPYSVDDDSEWQDIGDKTYHTTAAYWGF